MVDVVCLGVRVEPEDPATSVVGSHGVVLTATVTILPHIFTIRSTTPTVGVTYHWVPNLLGHLMCPCRDGSVTTAGMETKTPG